MPRTGRVVLPNYAHHIVQRGHNQQVVFTAVEENSNGGPRFLSFEELETIYKVAISR